MATPEHDHLPEEDPLAIVRSLGASLGFAEGAHHTIAPELIDLAKSLTDGNPDALEALLDGFARGIEQALQQHGSPSGGDDQSAPGSGR
jgi:hypothetical protein